MGRFRPRFGATQSTDRVYVLVFASHERNSSMMVAGCVFVVKSYSFHTACWICCLTHCRRRNTESWALHLHALWGEGGSSHQRNSSTSGLVCSSMPLIATGLVNCRVFRQDTPLKVLRFPKRKHNCFHGSTGTTFLEVLAEVPDIVNAWKAHKLARNLKYNSLPRTGETCNAKSFFCFVKKLHEGLFSNQDAWEKARAHHAALQKLRLLRRAVCNARQRSGLLCVVHRRQHHFRDRARTFEHVALRRSERRARLPHQARVHCRHVAFLPCVGTSMEPAPPAIFLNCADVIGWLKCPKGKSVLYAHAGTPREKKEEGDRKCKNVDSNDTSSRENKAVDYCLPRARGLLGHGPRQFA